MFEAYAEAGGNVVDTAVNYTNGASERIVGELVAPDRDRFVLSTKYSLSTDPRDPNASGNQRKNLTASLEASLRRLGTDHVDLYWVHIWDPRTPLEETMRALDDAVSAGKVLYVGFSDAPAWVVSRANTLAEWRGWAPVVAVQVPYSLLQRDIERDILPMAESLGLSLAAWSPLAGGVLSGKLSVGTTSEPSRVAATSLSERDHKVARDVSDLAKQLGASASQVAIAWTMAKKPNIHPILGARRLSQLEDNLGATKVRLGPQHLEALNETSAITLGFPNDFIRETEALVYGEVGAGVQLRQSR